MTDLEMTKLCAEAMDYKHMPGYEKSGRFVVRKPPLGATSNYNPLRNDAQAMALVKKFELSISMMNDGWTVWLKFKSSYHEPSGCAPDLNRAIVECVAKMQGSRDD